MSANAIASAYTSWQQACFAIVFGHTSRTIMSMNSSKR